MNIMSNQQFQITQYLDESKGDFESIRKTLFDKGVMSKDYPDKNMVLLYHKFNEPITTELGRECRSLVIERSTCKILSYSCMTPRMNKDGLDYLLSHAQDEQIIHKCYEGTFLSVFYYNDMWYVSTRRCLDSNESLFNQNKSHFQMLEDTLNSAGYSSFDDFSKKLDTTKSYYFVLIHHNNKHVIDYTAEFGLEYKRLCLVVIRDSNMMELELVNEFESSGVIFIPEKLNSINDFSEENKHVKYDKPPTNEGIVVKVFDKTKNLYNLIKLQTFSYQFALVIGMDQNMFKGLIYLYQNDKLVDYFSENMNLMVSMKKIVNPLNTNESYDTIGMVDGVFKVCTSELFELFKLLWSVKTGKNQNKELYDMLPKEYKDLLYAIRGIYYKKKAGRFSTENKLEDIKSSYLKISDVYVYLKTISTDVFVAFLRMRKLMFNWVKMCDDDMTKTSKLVEFSTTSKFCDKVHLKLTAIFTNKLFPNIMPNDMPPK